MKFFALAAVAAASFFIGFSAPAFADDTGMVFIDPHSGGCVYREREGKHYIAPCQRFSTVGEAIEALGMAISMEGPEKDLKAYAAAQDRYIALVNKVRASKENFEATNETYNASIKVWDSLTAMRERLDKRWEVIEAGLKDGTIIIPQETEASTEDSCGGVPGCG